MSSGFVYNYLSWKVLVHQPLPLLLKMPLLNLHALNVLKPVSLKGQGQNTRILRLSLVLQYDKLVLHAGLYKPPHVVGQAGLQSLQLLSLIT